MNWVGWKARNRRPHNPLHLAPSFKHTRALPRPTRTDPTQNQEPAPHKNPRPLYRERMYSNSPPQPSLPPLNAKG